MEKIKIIKNERSLEFETKSRRSVIYKFKEGFRADRSHFYMDGGWKTTGNIIYASAKGAIIGEWTFMSAREHVPDSWIMLLEGS